MGKRLPGVATATTILCCLVLSTITYCQDQPKEEPKKLPKMIDLGADKCIPCKMMAPILEKLKEELKGKAEVIFIDVWKDPRVGWKHKIQLIPTQIFFDAEGKEVFRHVGFFSREDILAQLKKMGVETPEEK